MRLIMRFDCFLNSIVQSFKYGFYVDGHQYELIYENDDVQILRCEDCGCENIGWKKEEYLPW